MSFTRKKTVEMDGMSVSVAPLTCAQTDEFLATQEEIVSQSDLDVKAKSEKLEKLWFKFVVDGMNNADPDLKMTIERLRSEMDKVLASKLKEEIMAMSGIAIRGEVQTP